MSKTTTNDSPIAMDPQNDREDVPLVEGGLEVVLKSGGVYCFVKRNPTRADMTPPVGDAGDDRGLMPVDS